MHTKATIALSTVLGFCVVAIIMLLTARFLWLHRSAKKTGIDPDDIASSKTMKYTLHPNTPFEIPSASPERSLVRMLIPRIQTQTQKQKEKGRHVPSLSGILIAGDEGVYTSALFERLQERPGDIQLGALMERFAEEAAKRPVLEESRYPSEVVRFLASCGHRVRRGLSVKRKRDASVRAEVSQVPQRNSGDVDRVEKGLGLGLGRALSKKSTPILIPTFNGLPLSEESEPRGEGETAGSSPAAPAWTKHIQQVQHDSGNPRITITITPSELAALSVTLGAPVSPTTKTTATTTTQTPQETPQQSSTTKPPSPTSSVRTQGAFGISISSTPLENGGYSISLHQHKRSISQLPARGSGYSLIFAKHLAASALPFSQDGGREGGRGKGGVNSIVVTNETVEGVRAGIGMGMRRLREEDRSASASVRWIEMMPHAVPPTLHVLVPSPPSFSPSPSPTLSLHPLIPPIAALPFTGGLAPLSSTPIIQTVKFIASAGLPTGRLLQRLDALVDKLHRQAPSLKLFGPLLEDGNAGVWYRERQKVGRMGVGKKGEIEEEGLAEKAARMRRYVTVLERLMAIAIGPGMTAKEVLSAAQEATKREMERAYENALKAYRNNGFDPTAPAIPEKSRKRNSSLSVRTKGSTSSHASTLESPTPRSIPAPISPPTTPPRHSLSISLTQISPVSTPRNPITPNPSPNPKSPRTSMASTFSTPTATPNLGSQVEHILKAELPLDIPSIAVVARLVLVAWTLSVGAVAWEKDNKSGSFNVGGLEGVEGIEGGGVGKIVLY
ncbi:uncharacterized protein BDR25DRAFT_307126 [Lindgomyces ingoldianus]|uniref:Uncharacterized protein n=1 Tax=Lindgomyces ingoldianus TaxID=673940 RepID=A0ACB6QC11_9PLEO|nr:uncharacterized protein BDR25DRAFT_307126 [Lindgomyces ingoldianus]KAF2464579.1 hypothetical protein BDR25DRAFT_307126 [Lindgomyces ingoldianus]